DLMAKKFNELSQMEAHDQLNVYEAIGLTEEQNFFVKTLMNTLNYKLSNTLQNKFTKLTKNMSEDKDDSDEEKENENHLDLKESLLDKEEAKNFDWTKHCTYKVQTELHYYEKPNKLQDVKLGKFK